MKTDFDIIKRIILFVLGILIYMGVSSAIVYYSEQREQIYQYNPDIVPGTFLTFGIFFGFPITMLAAFWIVDNFIPFIRAAFVSAAQASSGE